MVGKKKLNCKYKHSNCKRLVEKVGQEFVTYFGQFQEGPPKPIFGQFLRGCIFLVTIQVFLLAICLDVTVGGP